MGVISNFTTREWEFRDENVNKLWLKMSEKDRKLFNFDVTTVNWDTFMKNSISGVRVFIFQDTPDTLPAARRKMFW